LEVRQPFDISRDGKTLAFVARDATGSRIYIRSLDAFGAVAVPGTEGAATPVFSPDARWIAFVSGQQVKKVALSGGAPVALAQAPDVHGLAWGPDDTIVYQPSWGLGLLRLSSQGGEPRRVTEGAPGEGTHLWPEFLPGGDWILFTVWRVGGYSKMSVHAVSLSTGKVKPVVEAAYAAKYATSGHLLFMREDTLMAAPFDARTAELTGEAVAVVPNLRVNLNNLNPFYDVSETGSLVYLTGGARWMDQELVWMDREGHATTALARTAPFLLPRLSPDDSRVAVNIQGQTFQAWVIDLKSGSGTRLNGVEDSGGAVWMPEGKRLVAWSNRPGYYTMVWLTADGSRSPEPLGLPKGSFFRPIDVSPDGRYLSYIDENLGGTGFDLMVLDFSKRPFEPRPFLNEAERRGSETAGMFSSDGRWISYVSDITGRDEVYISPFPGPGSRWQVSTEGGSWPMWNPRGGELFYLKDQVMMAVAVRPDSVSPVSTPKRLFEGPFTVFRAKNYVPYDVARDGERFLMMQPAHGDPDPREIDLVLGWFQELRRLVPTT
jgi:serine/threonine-protein kinase